jgi:hypothetical protein
VQRTEHHLSEELSTEVREIGADARQVVKDASDAIMNGESREMAHFALDDSEQVIQKARSLDRTVSDRTPEEVYILTRVLDSVVRTAKCGGNIAEIALRTSLRP